MSRIELVLHDLTSQARAGHLPPTVGRTTELRQLRRILLRSGRHGLIVGRPGAGKTALIAALVTDRLRQEEPNRLPGLIYRLELGGLTSELLSGTNLRDLEHGLRTLARQLDQAIVVIDDLHLLTSDDSSRTELLFELLETLTSTGRVTLIATATDTSYEQVLRQAPRLSRLFDIVTLTNLTAAEAAPMVEAARLRLADRYELTIEPAVATEALTLAERFGDRALPDSAIRLLDDACTHSLLDHRSTVTAHDLVAAVAEATQVPLGQVSATEQAQLQDLTAQLTARVIGQSAALEVIATTVARARLGLADPRRPRGSFLLLGPSGVGKTETAKALAELVYGAADRLVRLDMSEYSAPHSAARLTGAPPGYVGFEDGGQLTNPIARAPYSLIVLDELEKAHPRLCDIFLQVLDDGRLTDAAGRTVDFRETMLIATSNLGSQAIAAAAANGTDVTSRAFFDATLLPLLLETFRPEFINRFDAILVYQPLALTSLVEIAQQELARLAARLQTQKISFAVADDYLAKLIRPVVQPLLGARPIKRLIRDQFEGPLATRLLTEPAFGQVTITGEEAWLTG